MFYLNQSEINFHIIITESNFGVGTGEIICFGENIASLQIPHSQFLLNKSTSLTNPTAPNQVTKNNRYQIKKYAMEEWVSDCCLMPIQQFFTYIMTRTR